MSTACSVRHIDPVGVAESCLSSMFVGVFHHEGARRHYGYSRISPFHSDEGMPGWYLWFEGKSGAYGLKVADAVCRSEAMSTQASHAMVAARITIAYFPDPDEAIFESFSWFERIARVGDFFDGSGTPTTEARGQLQDSFFAVGHADILVTADGSLVELACTAPEEWVDIRPAGLDLSDDQGRPFPAVPPGGKDRRVPGWSLSHFLLDKIVCGFLFSQQRRLQQISGYRFDMPEFWIGDDNSIERRFDLGLKGCGLHLATAPSQNVRAVAGRVETTADWRDEFIDTVYPVRSQWETVWRSRGPQTSHWGCSHWWEIGEHHLHDHRDHLCSCYMDH